MRRLLPQDAPLSEHVASWADETREEGRGYRDMRNILFIGISAVTLALNADKDVSHLSSIDHLKFNAAGIAVASASALGMEYGRRKRERRANQFDELSQELSELNL